MNREGAPYKWLGDWVAIGVGETKRGSGRLVAVGELGITLQHGTRSGEYEQFYPWTAVRSIRPSPESAPPDDLEA